ncbi:hypothetical protein L7F22_063009 [Adiantum nelumboides]|nr:hypothetical protein [Adiantum nelumboides]
MGGSFCFELASSVGAAMERPRAAEAYLHGGAFETATHMESHGLHTERPHDSQANAALSTIGPFTWGAAAWSTITSPTLSYEMTLVSMQVRPNVVALVDSFNHTDHFLGSALGRYDGDAYNHLYNEALHNNPLNDSIVTDGYTEYLRPVLTGQLRSV